MKVFDFNVHLPFIKSEDVNRVIAQDLSLEEKGLIDGFSFHQNQLKQLDGINFLLFNTNLFTSPIDKFKSKLTAEVPTFSLTTLVDFRRKDKFEYVEQAYYKGARTIMFNSYLQRIATTDFPEVLQICQYAEDKGMIICLDGSYGTSKMYVYDNLKLACYIADAIQKVPIVIIHSGSIRILETMLLALDKQNVWLDTSFSLPFYIGSSIEKDYAFAYKKIGIDRVLYGSDIPYLNSEKAIDIHLNFFRKFNFSDTEIERIMYHNAIELLFGQ